MGVDYMVYGFIFIGFVKKVLEKVIEDDLNNLRVYLVMVYYYKYLLVFVGGSKKKFCEFFYKVFVVVSVILMDKG